MLNWAKKKGWSDEVVEQKQSIKPEETETGNKINFIFYF
jgi:hypothetical protein